MDGKLTTDHQDTGEASAEATAKLTRVTGLLLLVGVLVTLVAAVGFYHYQRTGALNAQLRAAHDEVKKKSAEIDDMKAQLEALSEQVHSLKAHAVARSSPVGEGAATSTDSSAEGAPSADPAPTPAAAAPPVVAAPPAEPAKIKKARAKRPGEDCELVGKSPAEQAQTLQRCVAAMDAPARPRAR